MPEQVLARRRRAEPAHADDAAARPDVAPPAVRDAGLDRDAGADAGRQHGIAPGGILRVEHAGAGNRDDPRPAAAAFELARGLDRKRHFRPGRDQDAVGIRAAIDEHVAAAGDGLELRRVARLLRQRLPRQREDGRRLPAADRRAPGRPGLRGVAGAPDFHARNHAQRREVLDRLVRRAVLAEADRVVRQHEDAARPDDGGHAQAAARIVGEDEEGAAERHIAAVQRDAVHDRAHPELAHAVVQVVAGRRGGGVRLAALDARVVGTGEVRGAAEQFRQLRAEAVQHGLRALASRGRLRRRLRRRGALHDPGLEALRQRPGRAPQELGGKLRVLRFVRLEAPAPARFRALARRARVPARADFVRDDEGLVRPAERLARERDLGVTEGCAVAFLLALLVRRAVTDDGLAADQRGLALLALRAADRARDRFRVVSVDRAYHLPAVGLEPLRRVVGEPARDLAVDRDAVVVVEGDELAEAPGPGKRAGLVRDALHQAAVAEEHPGVVVHDLVAGTVERQGELLLRKRHADRVRESLAERAGRRLDADRRFVLGVARGARTELAEIPDLVDAERVAGQVEC